MRRISCVMTASVMLCFVAGTTRADDADMVIARLLEGAKDNAQRARKLLDGVEALDLDANTAVKVLDKAADYALKSAGEPEGLQAGLDALKEIDRKAPARKDETRKRRYKLCRKAYDACPIEKKGKAAVALMALLDADGDRAAEAGKWAEASKLFGEAHEIAMATARRRLYFERKKNAVNHFLSAGRRLAKLKSSAALLPDDARLRQQILRMVVVDLDDPNRAKQHLTPEAPQAWSTYVPMAAKGMKGLSEDACNELCNWYLKSLAVKASPVAKELMLRKARAYCQRAIELHDGRDVIFLEGQKRLEKIDEELSDLGPVGCMLRRIRCVDLMKLVDLDFDATEDSWLWMKGTFCSYSRSTGTLRFPVDVTGSYRLSLVVAKTQKATDITFTLPVGPHEVKMTMHEYYAASRRGGGGGTGGRRPRRPTAGGVGTSDVTWMRLQLEGLPKSRTSSHAKEIDPGYGARKWAPYALGLAVRVSGDRAQIAATLNRQKWISWSGNTKDLPGAGLGGTIGVQFKSLGVLVSAAKLRPVDGKVKYRRADTGTKPTAETTDLLP